MATEPDPRIEAAFSSMPNEQRPAHHHHHQHLDSSSRMVWEVGTGHGVVRPLNEDPLPPLFESPADPSWASFRFHPSPSALQQFADSTAHTREGSNETSAGSVNTSPPSPTATRDTYLAPPPSSLLPSPVFSIAEAATSFGQPQPTTSMEAYLLGRLDAQDRELRSLRRRLDPTPRSTSPPQGALNTNAPVFVPGSPVSSRAPGGHSTRDEEVDGLQAQIAALQHQVAALHLVVQQPAIQRSGSLPVGLGMGPPANGGLAPSTAGLSPRSSLNRGARGRAPGWEANGASAGRRASWNPQSTSEWEDRLAGMQGGDTTARPAPQPAVFAPAGTLSGKWEALGLTGDVLRSIVRYGIGPPTRGHHRTVPILLQQFDMVAQSGSITERIQSYILPILQLLYTSNSQNSVGGGGPRPGLQVLIITATFDEASQAHRLANGIGSTLGIRAALCAGAAPPGPTETLAEVQRFQSMSPHILLGTPQRLHDLLAVKGALDVDGLTMLVVDEVDQILARNLHEFVTDIITHFLRSSGSSSSDPVVGSVGSGPEGGASAEGKNKGRQTCIVSCTVPQDVLTYAQTLKLREPVRVLVRRDETQQGIPQIRGLRQFYVYIATPALLAPAIPTSTATLTAANANPVSLPNGTSTAPGSPVLAAAKQQREAEREGKLEAFVDLLERWEFANCVVYCNSVDSVETVALRLQNRGIGALSLHQDMGNSARLSVLARFRSQATTGPTGKKALVVYDALARTLSDNHQVQLVINYELPRAVGDYIHRVACATHQGRGGTVINVVTPGQDLDTLRSIENYYRTRVSELPHHFSA